MSEHDTARQALDAYEEATAFDGSTPELAVDCIRAILLYVDEIADAEIASWVYDEAYPY